MTPINKYENYICNNYRFPGLADENSFVRPLRPLTTVASIAKGVPASAKEEEIKGKSS